MENFKEALEFWYTKSKQVLKKRKELKEELIKRTFLYDNSEYNPSFSIDLVNVCGIYEVAGGNPDAKESYYTGILTIDLIDNQINATWTIEDNQEQTGYGFIFNDTLILNFSYVVEDGLYSGIVAYQFLTPEVVIGKWTEEIAAENAFEMARKLSPDELGESYPEDFISYN